MQQSLVHVIAS